MAKVIGIITCNYTALDGPVCQYYLDYYLNHEP